MFEISMFTTFTISELDIKVIFAGPIVGLLDGPISYSLLWPKPTSGETCETVMSAHAVVCLVYSQY